jgi:CRP-like cAMP-binding protein
MKRMDHGISAVSKCEVAHLPHTEVEKLTARHPNLMYSLWRDTMVDTAVAHTWLASAGRRSAVERLAYFICEQYVRMEAVGLVGPGEVADFPVTQTQIADATGLSLVHVNKRLQILREKDLIGRNPLAIEILDWDGLKRFAGFNPAYLHFKTNKRPSAELAHGMRAEG